MSSFRSGMVTFHGDLEPLMVPIDSVTQHPANYNNGDVEALTESIMENGMYRPIYVQESTGHIIAGNHTWQACKELGAEQVPAIVIDIDDIRAKKIMLADNRIAALARPDNGQLFGLLQELATLDTITGTGYKEQDLSVLENLAKIPTDYDEFGQWPTITVQVPPAVKKAYMEMTEQAVGDRERFELVLRLAGWEG